jgi:hypothetical protein
VLGNEGGDAGVDDMHVASPWVTHIVLTRTPA